MNTTAGKEEIYPRCERAKRFAVQVAVQVAGGLIRPLRLSDFAKCGVAVYVLFLTWMCFAVM